MTTDDEPIELLRRMLLIRTFEETTIEVYRAGEMPGLAHSYAGQEASAVGVCSVLEDDDYITSTHRGHGHLLAKGADPTRMMLEIMGKDGGYCGGRGGSMHIADASLGILGANGVVAGGVGIALGAALSAQRRDSGQVAVCFIGDGAMNQGVTFEVLNMAALWSLPLIVACENNLYGQYSPLGDTLVGTVADRPPAFGVPAVQTDGMDVRSVRVTMSETVADVRAGLGPKFVEIQTYRYGGHHVAEVKSDYRSDDEVETWKQRDPILAYERHLLEAGTSTEDDLAQVRRQVEDEVAAARAAGLAADPPPADAISEGVYA